MLSSWVQSCFPLVEGHPHTMLEQVVMSGERLGCPMTVWLSLKIRIVCGIESMGVEDGLGLQRGGGLQVNPTVRKAFQPSEPGAKGSRLPSLPLSY